jgi:hypothetical protein
MEEQTVEREVGFVARSGIGKLGDGRSLECRHRVADFSKAINPAGSERPCAIRLIRSSVPGSRLPSFSNRRSYESAAASFLTLSRNPARKSSIGSCAGCT